MPSYISISLEDKRLTMGNDRFLEVACFSVESAIIAHKAGASRIELCADPAVGGVTPLLADLQAVKDAVRSTPVHVMIRPRGGNFLYDKHEIAQMHQDIAQLRPYADGFVLGMLSNPLSGAPSDRATAGGSYAIDSSTSQSLLEGPSERETQHDPVEKQTYKYTFHRAFDEVADWQTGLVQLANCGFNAVLVSGHKDAKAIDCADLLREMITFTRAQQLDLEIIVGGSVRSDNLQQLVTTTGAAWYHSSAIVDESGNASHEEIKKMRFILESTL